MKPLSTDLLAASVAACLLIATIAGAGVLITFDQALQARADPPLVERGQLYRVVWSCLPQPLGCYEELVRIETVREDGWVDALSCGGPSLQQIQCPAEAKWRSNLKMAISLQRVTLGRVAD